MRLPFIYRCAVLLHDVEDWTVAKIAERLGIDLPAAKQRLRRGRMMLVTARKRRRAARGTNGCATSLLGRAPRRLRLLDGELANERRRLLEQHLATCPTCPPLYAALVGVKAELGGLRDRDSVVSPALAQRIAHELDDRSSF